MKLWVLDSSSGRKKRSEEAAEAYFEVVEEKEEADVVALHETDVFDSNSYSNQSQYDDKLIVAFSGGEPAELSDNDIESGRVLRLSFPVPRSAHISLDSWKRISNLIESRGEENVWAKNELGLTSQENLKALSILCQGYLAVHAEKQDEEWGPPEIKPALKQMGWIELMEDEEDEPKLSGQLKNLSGKLSVVKDPKWWAAVFDEDSLTNRAKEEWGEADGWTKVEDLLLRVTGGPDEEDTDEGVPEPLERKKDREIVADAYCKLVERLGAEPCPQS